MKILQLRLLAFGPFTDVTTDLNRDREGVHLIYGPNEAGKSSALRAFRQMLFGIPTRSTDNFLHSHPKMRIGGVLQHSDGSVIEFVRRKGRINTLRSVDDKEVLDDALLEKFLGTMDADVFETMFGIGHEDLVRGGREIIQGGGKVGQALFAAGSGISDLRRVQADLQKEAEELFTPSASKRAINEAFAELRRNQKELKEAELPGREWEEHDRAFRTASGRKAEVEEQLETKERERNKLERVQEALPLIARRKELLQDFSKYAGAALLPEDFEERRRELLTELQIAKNSRDQALQSIEDTRKETERLEVAEAVLESADLIEELHQELGSHRKAAGDRVQLATRRDVLRGEAAEVLSQLRDDLTLEEAGRLKLKKTATARIQDLGSRYERLVTRGESASEEISKLASAEARLREQLEALEAPRPVDDLIAAVERAQEYGPLEDHCRSEFSEIQDVEQRLKTSLSRQRLWSGTLEELEGLSIPSLETIDRFEKKLTEAEADVSRLKSAAGEAEAELLEIGGKVESQRLEQEVPTEKDLADARRLRAEGWALVRKAWQEGRENAGAAASFAESVQAAGSLADAYEISVQRADGIADRLRREADRVAAKARLLADQQTRSAQLEHLRKQLQEATEKLAQANREWAAAWENCGVSPLSPREMRAWCQDQRAIAEEAAKLRARRVKADTLQAGVQKQREDLDRFLQALSEPPADEKETLSDLIKKAQRVIKKQEEVGTKKEQLLSDKKARESEITEARAKAERIEAELAQWQRDWEEALRPLGLGRDALPAQANAVLEELKNLFDKLKEAEGIQKRITEIDRDAAKFAQDLRELAERAAPDLREPAVEQLASELNARLNRARSAKTKLESLQAQQGKQTKKLEQAETKISGVTAQLAGMCKEVGCESYDELPEAERRSSTRRKMEAELEELEKQLRKLGAGATVEEFVGLADQEDPDTIATRIERLVEEIDKLAEERSNLDQTIGSERTVLEGMDGSALAAELAEERQQILGLLETDVEKYVRLRLASAVLARSIEHYREKHQGPILERTNDLFSRLTLGSFEGIRAEYDEQGEPVLVGVRPGGRELVGVEGMSDGSTDQLYLALRLASLEAYLENNEPMPFIVDDILIKFDNDRAMAALEILAELAKKTQIIFFTHHRHLAELAESSMESNLMIKHTL